MFYLQCNYKANIEGFSSRSALFNGAIPFI